MKGRFFPGLAYCFGTLRVQSTPIIQNHLFIMIAYQDFVPEKIASGGFFKMPSYESLNECLRQANRWIAANGIEVVNVETVVLPNMYAPGEEGSADVQLRTSGEMSATWYQFIRVWHVDKVGSPPPLGRA